MSEDLRKSLYSGLIQASALSAIGLFGGIVAGWIGVGRESIDAAAKSIADVYLILGIIYPVVLVYYTWASMGDEDRPLYATRTGAFGMLLIAGLGGSPVASALFMVFAINIGAIFGGFNHIDLRVALLERVGGYRLLLVVGITTVVALAAAVWAYRKASTD